MTRKRQSSSAVRIWRELSQHFQAAGWTLLERPSASLHMTSNPAPGIEHYLFANQPFPADQLPSPDVMGVGCGVNVYFADLEEVINSALRRDPERLGRVSVALRLSQLVPEDHLYARSVHLVPLSESAMPAALSQVIGDFEAFLEPVRRRLSAIDVFADEAYTPPNVDSWTWTMRRVAYLHLHAPGKERERYYARVERESESVLDTHTPGESAASSPASVNLQRIRADATRRSVADVRELIRALRAGVVGNAPQTH